MRNIFLVFRRDYLGYIQAWGFWLGILSMPMIIVLFGVLGGLAASSAPARYYTVLEATPLYGPAIKAEFTKSLDASQTLPDLSFLPEEARDAALEQASIHLPNFIYVEPPADDIDGLRPWLLGERALDGPLGQKPLFAAIIVSAGGDTVQYWSADVNVDELREKTERAIRTVTRNEAFQAANIASDFLKNVDQGAPELVERRIRPLDEQASEGDEITIADRAPYIISIALAYFLWLIVFSVIQYLLMGTIEERSNKIFDTLLTSVKLPQLLAGKLGAVLAVTLTMVGSWGVASGLFLVFGASVLPDEARQLVFDFLAAGLQMSMVLPALVCFILGYLMYGVVFMALGSLCDTIQEAQTLISPMMLLLMLPMFMIIVAFNDPASQMVAFMSWVPIFTPFLLILRMPTEPPIWEILAQIALMGGTTALSLWLSTKVYRAGAVHGAGVSDATGWMKRLLPGVRSKEAVG